MVSRAVRDRETGGSIPLTSTEDVRDRRTKILKDVTHESSRAIHQPREPASSKLVTFSPFLGEQFTWG